MIFKSTSRRKLIISELLYSICRVSFESLFVLQFWHAGNTGSGLNRIEIALCQRDLLEVWCFLNSYGPKMLNGDDEFGYLDVPGWRAKYKNLYYLHINSVKFLLSLLLFSQMEGHVKI